MLPIDPHMPAPASRPAQKSPGIFSRIRRYFKASKEANARVNYVADQLLDIQGSATKEQRKALKDLLRSNPDKASINAKVEKAQKAFGEGIQVKVFTKEKGQKRILLSTTQHLGEGSYASVTKAIEISGRVNMLAKERLFKEKVKFGASSVIPDSFAEDKQAKLRFSKILHQGAKKNASWQEDPTQLFLKYKEAHIGEDSEMTAQLLEPCDEVFFRKLPPEDKMAVCAQLMKAMAHMEHNHLIHRDLKFENLLIKRDKDFKPQIVICDYGLMHRKDDGPLNHAAGTPGYKPPPTKSDTYQSYAERQDRYALGMILLQITTEFNLKNLAPEGKVDTDQLNNLIDILGSFNNPLCRLMAGLIKQPPAGPISLEEAQWLFDQVSIENFRADQLPGKK